MTTAQRAGVVLGLVAGLGCGSPMALFAAEHGGTAVGGGKEHGGAAVGASQARGGMTHGALEADEASLLRRAAAALRKGEARPDLAAKLEQLAQKEQMEKKS